MVYLLSVMLERLIYIYTIESATGVGSREKSQRAFHGPLIGLWKTGVEESAKCSSTFHLRADPIEYLLLS
jgi:hypothetical protein